MLSICYRDIVLFRFDDRIRTVYFLAEEEIEVIVSPDGNWRFLDAA
jgi:hypothetical protein